LDDGQADARAFEGIALNQSLENDKNAPEYHERIFIIFQTLVERDALESTGVGLAIVKKIVERQGGRIWVESAEGQGATFYFTWPKQAVAVPTPAAPPASPKRVATAAAAS
ncbi:MAG: hypothetical protein EOO57_17000, partial [Hymenobacter sp.]